MTRHDRPRRLFVATLALILGITALPDGGGGAPPAAAAPPPSSSTPPSDTTYSNPVTEPFADTYADPAVIRGKDG